MWYQTMFLFCGQSIMGKVPAIILQPRNYLMSWDLFPQHQSNRETPWEFCVWLLSVSFLAHIHVLWEAYRLDRHPPLCDCSIMCAMLLCFLPSKGPMATSSWKLLLIHDYPQNFLSGLNFLLHAFISVANQLHSCELIKINQYSWASK